MQVDKIRYQNQTLRSFALVETDLACSDNVRGKTKKGWIVSNHHIDCSEEKASRASSNTHITEGVQNLVCVHP